MERNTHGFYGFETLAVAFHLPECGASLNKLFS